MSKSLFSFTIALLVSLILSANDGSKSSKSDPFASRYCRSTFTTVQLSEKSNDAVITFLRETNENFYSLLSSLQLKYQIESPGGVHFTFEQEYDGIPVFNSQVKVNLNNAGEIKSIFDNSYFTGEWDNVALLTAYSELNEKNAEGVLKNFYNDNVEIIGSRKVIAVLGGKPGLYTEVEARNFDMGIHSLFLIDEQLNIKFEQSLTSNFSSSPDSASGLVYLPDPLTSAHVPYGGTYVDDDDNTNTALDNELKPVTILVTKSGNTYFLENDYVRVVDFSAPSITPVNSTSPVFQFNRSQSGFEDVNALYHITVFNHYVQSIGFVNLSSFKIDVDPHGNNGDDQSNFWGGNPMHLVFGTGGVDDAEDADVVIHEYGHAFSYRASPNSNFGFERESIDEGLCDYLAAGYSKSHDTYGWDEIFSWDGHNEFWSGRTVGSNKVYPSGKVGNTHLDGEIWSSALTVILNIIGRETADQILMQSLYGLTGNITMKDAALLYLQADTVLFQGANFCVIYNTFLSRGLVDAIANAPCPGIGIASAKEDPNILVYNSEGFLKGENLVIELKNTSEAVRIELYNAEGKLLLQETPVNSSVYLLKANSLPAGVYILKVQTSAGQKTEKLVRVK